ncbi:unnamed protein product, partial [Laminaria digitata]
MGGLPQGHHHSWAAGRGGAHHSRGGSVGGGSGSGGSGVSTWNEAGITRGPGPDGWAQASFLPEQVAGAHSRGEMDQRRRGYGSERRNENGNISGVYRQTNAWEMQPMQPGAGGGMHSLGSPMSPYGRSSPSDSSVPNGVLTGGGGSLPPRG